MAAPANKTRADLARAVLRRLRILRAGEAPTAVMQTQVDEAYDGLYSELSHHGVAYWDRDGIPVEVFQPLSRVCAFEIADAFGKQFDAGDAMARLRAVAAKPWSGKPVVTEYF